MIKIRREKQLRQLKEEIEHLHALSQSQDLDKGDQDFFLLINVFKIDTIVTFIKKTN